MFDLKDFKTENSQISFDFKGYLNKLLGYWKLILFFLVISLFIAFQVNIRKQQLFKLSNNIAIKEETNPLFTNNTSLIFNWGGTSDQIQNVVTTLQSRTHNEYVVDELNLSLNYLKEGRFHLEDIYGKTGYFFEFNKQKNQLIDHLIAIRILDNNRFELSINIEEENVSLFNYSNLIHSNYKINTKYMKIYLVAKMNQQLFNILSVINLTQQLQLNQNHLNHHQMKMYLKIKTNHLKIRFF